MAWFLNNETKLKISKKTLNDIRKEICGKKSVELLMVFDDKIKTLNKTHRKKNKPTDVLSFPVDYEFADFLGSIVISVDTAKRQADELKHDLNDEIAILFIHGLLHLIGMDHEKDEGEMRKQEALLCEKFSLNAPLTSRHK